MEETLFSFLDDISSAKSLSDIQKQATKCLESIGFGRFTHIGFNPLSANPRAAEMSTFPIEWVQHYVDNRYVYIDATVLMARRSSMPFASVDIETRDDLTFQQKKLTIEAHDFGIKNTISIPIHGAMNQFGLLVAVSNDSEKEYLKYLSRKKYQLQLVGMSLHSAIHDFLDEGKDEPPVQLSPRETECLLWTARGKTAWEIGEILKLKDSTVNEYIQNASRKLGCNQKTLAVTKAIMSRHIAP